MRAVVCKAFGPPEDLVVETVDDPVPGRGQLLVEVKAAPVVFPDTLMLQDKYQYKAPPPYIPGGEVAGVVVAIGDQVEGWSIGDRVLGALGATGGFAELCAIPAATARRLPVSVDFAAVAGLN
jgi:NADPH2:quinone reductase